MQTQRTAAGSEQSRHTVANPPEFLAWLATQPYDELLDCHELHPEHARRRSQADAPLAEER